MAWSAGTYSRPSTSVSPAVGSTTIDSAAMNTYTADVTTAINTCRNKDGSNNPIANLPMANYRHTGVGDGAALTDYASVNQVIDGPLTYCATPSAVGTDAYAVSLPINPVAYVAGNEFTFITDVANTGACTVNFNSIGAVAIKVPDGAGSFTDPANGDIQAGTPITVRHDGTRFVLINPYVSLSTFSVTASAAELNYNDITTLGEAEASKVVTIDGTSSFTLAGMTCTDAGILTTANINGGTWQGTIDGAWDATGQTCSDLGTVTTVTINGGAITGITDITVADGGTGRSTGTTAYAPVCVGTTATGAQQTADTGLSTSGYVFTSTGASSLPSFQAIPAQHTFASAVPSTSGTSVEVITGVPATANVIVIALDNVDLSNVDDILVQVGHSGTTYLATGYTSGAVGITSTTGFILTDVSNTGEDQSGIVTLTHMGSNVWTSSGVLADINGTYSHLSAGRIDMGANVLTAVQLVASGANTFTQGQVRAHYY